MNSAPYEATDKTFIPSEHEAAILREHSGMIGLTENMIANYVDTYHAADYSDPCDDCGEYECTCDVYDCHVCFKKEQDCRCEQEAA